jgi:hypothetical protein
MLTPLLVPSLNLADRVSSRLINNICTLMLFFLADHYGCAEILFVSWTPL